MEVEIVIKRDDEGELGLITEPGDGVAADGEENECHVELERLCSAFSCAHTVTHDVVHSPASVLNELPREQCEAYEEPQSQNPGSFPVVFHEVAATLVVAFHGIWFQSWFQLLTQHMA